MAVSFLSPCSAQHSLCARFSTQKQLDCLSSLCLRVPSLPSSALWGCWPCPPQAAASDSAPSLHVPLQTESAASAAQMPHSVPACLPGEQLGGTLACSCLFSHARDSLSAHPSPAAQSSAALTPAPGTISGRATEALLLHLQRPSRLGLPLPQVTAARTCSLYKLLDSTNH